MEDSPTSTISSYKYRTYLYQKNNDFIIISFYRQQKHTYPFFLKLDRGVICRHFYNYYYNHAFKYPTSINPHEYIKDWLKDYKRVCCLTDKNCDYDLIVVLLYSYFSKINLEIEEKHYLLQDIPQLYKNKLRLLMEV